jgi:hypothetical protein
LWLAICATLCFPAEATVVPSFRASAYKYFLGQCYAMIAAAPQMQVLSSLGVVDPTCACVATWDAHSVTLEEFGIITTTGVFPDSFRTRKDTYSKVCLETYVDSN